ncbi:hypothetical protein N7517_006640 [Penicillium concentricum]|uniref:Uncharacterized protein n=1 Tax=Penicillium concentricum TaxID=293559 RepID=A0A9W9VBJ0_9EURO|nr:uncharacterized protein N7517_006640 [Penicillium concentricum]KAJ5374634.1 hypothetical protein N7517_006640 [Penicillium concentricum]
MSYKEDIENVFCVLQDAHIGSWFKLLSPCYNYGNGTAYGLVAPIPPTPARALTDPSRHVLQVLVVPKVNPIVVEPNPPNPQTFGYIGIQTPKGKSLLGDDDMRPSE